MTIVWKASRVHCRAQNSWAAIIRILPSIFEFRVHYFLVLLNFNSSFSPFWKRMGWCFFFLKFLFLCFLFLKKMLGKWFYCQDNGFSVRFMLFPSMVMLLLPGSWFFCPRWCFCCHVHVFSVDVEVMIWLPGSSFFVAWIIFCFYSISINAFSEGKYQTHILSTWLQFIFFIYLFSLYSWLFI